MSRSGPVILIDDDADDRQIFSEVMEELGVTNSLICFDNCKDALNYLETTMEQPFVIFCDVAIPGQNGLEFKRYIDSTPDLRRKSIPFVFFATMADQDAVNDAYLNMTVQGFFKKPATYSEIKMLVIQILSYWVVCRHPNNENPPFNSRH